MYECVSVTLCWRPFRCPLVTDTLPYICARSLDYNLNFETLFCFWLKRSSALLLALFSVNPVDLSWILPSWIYLNFVANHKYQKSLQCNRSIRCFLNLFWNFILCHFMDGFNQISLSGQWYVFEKDDCF